MFAVGKKGCAWQACFEVRESSMDSMELEVQYPCLDEPYRVVNSVIGLFSASGNVRGNVGEMSAPSK